MATFVTGRSLAVDGLKQTVNALKKERPELGRAATKAGKQLTDKLITPEARNNWASQRIRPSVANRVVVSAAGQTWAGVRVRYKDKTFPFGAGVVFGSLQYKQFPKWVGNQHTGGDKDLIVGAAVRKKGDEFGRKYMGAVAEGMEDAIRNAR